jgi:alpha,alpha-trehalose phosphorylase
MIKQQTSSPPHHVYPVDEWKIIENRYYPQFLAGTETLFALSNGYLGMRGCFEEDTPVEQDGTFVNAFYESWPIVYGEEAYGFAKTGQTIVNVPNSKIIKLYIDDEPLSLRYANLLNYTRTLDMKAGILDRALLWETPAGKRVLVKSRRLVSFSHRHLAAIEYKVTVLNAPAPVVISSEVVYRHEVPDTASSDPRKARDFPERPLLPEQHYVPTDKDTRVVLSHATRRSKLTLACGIDHSLETECAYVSSSESNQDSGKLVFSIEAVPGQPISLTKYMTYHTSSTAPADELCTRAERTLDRAVEHGFSELLDSQQLYLQNFWQRADVQIEGQPTVQQDIRFNLFQLCQATARVEGAGVPAKGLTGQAYEGHYFWDGEIYVVPFLIYTTPRIARNLLKFRHDKLRGALFPWRTINGEEASAYYAAGTAQYHINADILYILRKYIDLTGDSEFLQEIGVELLVETARMWCDLGFYSERMGGKFCIHGVTGPDEYTTVVNNNAFTNLMARENLRYAAQTVTALQKEKPGWYAVLVDKTGLAVEEIAQWQTAADKMYVPYDQQLGIHPQDDHFLEQEPWDFSSTPADKYPIFLHHHPLMIYRRQIIKQADVVLAMFLLGHEFTLEQKKRNFDYYDPLTTGDSSLSASIQSIAASEIFYTNKAYDYFRYAAFMDLANVRGNVQDGVHLASMGGTWMAVVYGFGGMRDEGGRLSFDPKLPTAWRRLKFPLMIQGMSLVVDIQHDCVTYLLRQGSALTISHQGQDVRLTGGVPRSCPLRSSLLPSSLAAAGT